MDRIQVKWRSMRTLLATILCLALAGCALTYKPAPFWGAGGYSSKDINTNTVSVNYLTGRGATAEKVKNYALYRCAEVTLEKGFDWFLIREGSARSQSGGYTSSASATYVITMYRGTAPVTRQHIANEQPHDARALLARLGPGIVWEDGQGPRPVPPRTELPATKAPARVARAPAIAPAPAPAAPADPASVAAPAATPATAGVRLEDADAVPLLDERGRQGYRTWLGKRAPRAFVIAEGGKWNATWGTNPRNADDPKDPAQRAMAQCQRRGLKSCRLYAVDDRVVWAPD